MKTLVIVRHAKSSWDDPNISDFERSLNNRGERDAPFMASKIKDLEINPDLIISSPANRAFTTASVFAEELKYPIDKIQKKESIYTSGPRQILTILNHQSDENDTIMIFGHNPDLSTLVHFLSDLDFSSLPTCGVVCIDFDVPSWSMIGDELGKLRFFEYPKMYLNKKDI